MFRTRLVIGTLVVASVFLLGSAPAQEPAKEPAKPEPKPMVPTKDTVSDTFHVITLDGVKIPYKATAGYLILKDEEGKALASFFHIAYTRTDVKDKSKRPVTFTFNGGPGSSSVWLHMGAFGPRRVKLTDDGEALKPPYALVENEFSLLDQTDLVFIDPVSTGYSRPAKDVKNNQFHGVQEDVQTVGDFIRLYVTRNQRWASPLFLAGESYGTTRAAGLAGYLQDRHGLNLSGIVLVSAVLNFGTIRFDEGNDLPYPLFLPSYTATAWYHKKLPADLQGGTLRKALDEAEKFALNDYPVALIKGDLLKPVERKEVADKLARYTGLSSEYILKSDLRVTMSRFGKELLRGSGRSIGRFDSRYKGIDRDALGTSPEYDPSYAAVQGPYTATVNHYLRNELNFESDLPYEILTGRVHPWDYGSAKNSYLNVAPSLRSAMTKNQALKVFVANGYYDLATPYFATEYTFNHLNLDASLRRNVTMAYYEAGHMMYVHRGSHDKLKRDLAAFYQSVLR